MDKKVRNSAVPVSLVKGSYKVIYCFTWVWDRRSWERCPTWRDPIGGARLTSATRDLFLQHSLRADVSGVGKGGLGPQRTLRP